MLMIVLQICKMRVVQHEDEDSFYLVSAFISCERRENLSQKTLNISRRPLDRFDICGATDQNKNVDICDY